MFYIQKPLYQLHMTHLYVFVYVWMCVGTYVSLLVRSRRAMNRPQQTPIARYSSDHRSALSLDILPLCYVLSSPYVVILANPRKINPQQPLPFAAIRGHSSTTNLQRRTAASKNATATRVEPACSTPSQIHRHPRALFRPLLPRTQIMPIPRQLCAR